MSSDPGLHDAPAVEITALDKLPPGTTLHVPIGVSPVLLANVDGSVIAVDDICLRCGSALSGAAFLGPLLVCRNCGWQYDLKRAEVVGLPALKLGKHIAWIERGRVFMAADQAGTRDAVVTSGSDG